MEIADHLNVHRAVAYRLVSTLEARGLIARNNEGQIFIGGGIMALASSLAPQLRTIALPHLQALANETKAAASLSVAQGNDCVVILVTEPDGGLFRVTYKLGVRHSLDCGAHGIAILSGRPPTPDDASAVIQARIDGYAVTRGQLQAGAVGVATPIRSSSDAAFGLEACIGVVALSDLDIDMAASACIDHARCIATEIHQ